MGTRPVQARARSPLPSRAGVGASCVALPVGPWATILEFLSERFPAISRDIWLSRMAAGEVVDQGGAQVGADCAYRPRLRLYYYRQIADEPRIPFQERVLFQDEQLVVADKPHFLPVTPSGSYLRETLLVRLKERLQLRDLVPIHRIDRETAGLVVFSVDARTRGAYQTLFRDRRVHKQYEAVLQLAGDLLPDTYESRLEADRCFFRMRECAGEPNTQTQFRLLARHAELAHYQLTPSTGKKHQLRVHCATLAAPIVNDRFYPELTMSDGAPDDHARPLQLLARSIAFVDPVSGRPREFVSEQVLQCVRDRVAGSR